MQPTTKHAKEAARSQAHGDQPKHYAVKAMAGSGSKKSFARGNSSDDDTSEDDREPMVHRAYKAVVRTSELDREPVVSSTGDFLIKPYGCGVRSKTAGAKSLESGAADAGLCHPVG